MEHIAALLLIVGCPDGSNTCREMAPPVSVFETMDECRTSIMTARREAAKTAQRVLSQCVDVDPAMDEEDAQLVWEVKGERLFAEIVSGGEVASFDRGVIR